MRVFVSVLTASLLMAASASAQTPVSNQDYLQLARCAGLLAGARQDASAFDSALRATQGGRDRSVRNAAAAYRRSAVNQMRRADPSLKARLETEISAQCAAPTA
jgi:D-alanyl-D-alanine dipeptidase